MPNDHGSSTGFFTEFLAFLIIMFFLFHIGPTLAFLERVVR